MKAFTQQPVFTFLCFSCDSEGKLVSGKGCNISHAIRKHEKKFKHDSLPREEYKTESQTLIIKHGSFKI
jgi:hypothetical protein